MKLKSKCCKKFEKKAKACKGCPVMAMLFKKNRQNRLKAAKKRLAKAG